MDLSIIILSYNTKDITDECLNRLHLSVVSCQTKLKNKIQVIVLDNASIDGSVEMIKKNHPWVELIESKENTGFARGNNIALKKTKYPIILLLNSDVYVNSDSLERALECFKNPENSVLGSKLVFADGSLQPSAGYLPNPFNTICWILGISLIPLIGKLTNPIHPKDKSFFNEISNVGWITGAFFMMRREVYENIGGFDEALFMYAEEVELCKRINDAHFKVCYIPTIKVTHLHGASSKFDSNFAFTSELKGLRYYFQKYYFSWYFLVRLFLILGLVLRIIAFSLLGKTKRAKAYIEGLEVI